MKFKEALGKSILPVFGGLLLGGYLASLIFALGLLAEDHSTFTQWLTSPALAFGLLLFASLLAAPVAFIIGWPAYSLLLSRRIATYPSAFALALVLAGIAWLIGESALGGLVALYGLCIAGVTHALQVRSNNSFKPTPLRGVGKVP